jgi:hypothetical protein
MVSSNVVAPPLQLLTRYSPENVRGGWEMKASANVLEYVDLCHISENLRHPGEHRCTNGANID